MSVSVSRRLFTTKEFREIVEAGVFREDDRLELVDGEIVETSPIGSRHAACVRKLNLLLRSVGDRAFVDVQSPLGISEGNDFYPDVALLKPRTDNYVNEIPGTNDVLLVIEVSDTTLRFDLSRRRATQLPEPRNYGSSTSRGRASGSTGSLSRATTAKSSKPVPAMF
jgi:Uma2 family endonuclease